MDMQTHPGMRDPPKSQSQACFGAKNQSDEVLALVKSLDTLHPLPSYTS